jgi:acyl carrier protein
MRGTEAKHGRRPVLTTTLSLEAELAGLIVEALHLEITPEEIDAEAPLFGDGLGLDSIDALEIALAVSKRYGFQLRSDDERNHQIFRSLRALAAHIETNRTG